MGKSATRIGNGKRTVACNYSGLSDYFVPGWDKKAGAEQAMDRVAERLAMGNKKTPLLGGALKPKRG